MKDAIRYVVTVTAVIERVEKAGKEWQKLSAAPDAPYGYTPEIEKTVQREVEVYQQRVDQLDLAKLVAVVNQPPALADKLRAATQDMESLTLGRIPGSFVEYKA
jgi:hypothetical protein